MLTPTYVYMDGVQVTYRLRAVPANVQLSLRHAGLCLKTPQYRCGYAVHTRGVNARMCGANTVVSWCPPGCPMVAAAHLWWMCTSRYSTFLATLSISVVSTRVVVTLVVQQYQPST